MAQADGLQDRDLQKYYEELLSMFASEGWKFFVEDLERIKEAAEKIDGITTLEELHNRHGKREILHIILGQPNTISAAYDELLEAEGGNA